MISTTLIIASHNLHKVEEIRAVIGDHYHLLSLADLKYFDEIIEDGLSFRENAKIKTDCIFQKFHRNVLSDDSGLEVNALNGQPGIYSARYAGETASSEANIAKLLLALRHISDRSAQFKTVIALNWNGFTHFFEGIVTGKIAISPKGVSGFGYDPVFIPDGYNQSFSEMDSTLKNKISHRAIALKKLSGFLNADAKK